MLLFFCAFYAASIPSAYAIMHASSTDIDAIQKQIYLANKMDAEVRKADIDLHDAKVSRAGDDKVIELEKTLAREKDKQSAARTKAIHMTILAYDLAPVNHRGTSVMPWTKDRQIDWLPVAHDIEARQIQNGEGTLKNSSQPKKPVLGVAYSDGVSYIAPEAFEKGVGALASTLYHERIHFEQMTTAGRGNVMSRAEGESEAYKAEMDNSAIFFDPVNPDDRAEIDYIAAQYQEETATVAQEQEARKGFVGLLRRLRGRVDPPDMFESKVHTNAELADIKGLVAQAHAQAARAHLESEKRELAKSQSDHDEQLRKKLVAIAERSCANQGGATQAELDKLPQPISGDFASTLPQGLKGCILDIYCSLSVARDANAANAVLRFYIHEKIPAPVQVIPQPDPAIPATANTPFVSVLIGLKNYSVRACNSTAEVPVDKSLTDPRENFEFMKDLDNQVANKLASGLGNCEVRLFRDLIWAIRHGDGRLISSDWVKNTIAGYSPPPPDTSSGNIPPPPRQKTDDPPVNRSCPVDENGVRACPAGW